MIQLMKYPEWKNPQRQKVDYYLPGFVGNWEWGVSDNSYKISFWSEN